MEQVKFEQLENDEKQQLSPRDMVKIGTQVPKTTNAANLRNFNNLR